MDQVKEMLAQILANQMVLYKRLEEIENKMKGSVRSASDETYLKELKDKAEKILPTVRKLINP